MLIRFCSLAKRHHAAWICAISILAISSPVQAEEQRQDQKPKVKAGKNYVFKPIEITPSPYGEDHYGGRFLFINKGPTPLMVSGFDKPTDGKFVPRFVKFETLLDGAWKKIEVGYCGTGAQSFAMKPDQSYEFAVDLEDFEEQQTPLTGRIGFDVPANDDGGWVNFWSEPFVMDWKKDRESDKFTTAKKENITKARAVFSKAGFKDELLVGDDFCNRLIQSMMKMTLDKKASTLFNPFAGKLDITPIIELDGKIRIDFTSEKNKNGRSEYTGWFSLDPRKFTPKWFRKAMKHHVKAGKWGGGIKMELDDGDSWASPLYLSINYVPIDNSNAPSEKESEELFTKMLNVLGKSMKE